MINWKSILSLYDDKPTLLQWLKLVKKALDESVLESVGVNNVDETTITLSFNFADGTKITTPSITLPRGLTGATGATGAPGAPGKDGVSVTGFDTVSDEVVGNETLTTVRAHFSDGNTDEFVVTATNGKDGEKSYKHFARFSDNTGFYQYYLIFVNKKSAPLILTSINASDLVGFIYGIRYALRDSAYEIVNSIRAFNSENYNITFDFFGANGITQDVIDLSASTALPDTPIDVVSEI